MLSNESILSIMYYLSSTDIIQAFSCLNRRFDELVQKFSHNFTFPHDTSPVWLIEHRSFIENIVESISLDIKLIPNIFSCTHSFCNLRTVILKCPNAFTVELYVSIFSALGAIISTLNILRLIDIWPSYDYDDDDDDDDNDLSVFSGSLYMNNLERVLMKNILVYLSFITGGAKVSG
ncbi:unnamed protein product [Rotaria sordida]|uniref:F-box domain-containing protein n=1 Tax=Rotaria sordida TaxID=392033 RepID=A0A815MZS5_9BILA|nr:unnamed protein product [Rotaria sordida]CAF1511728.1 unnamed protein product [Rotaria sordida]